MWLWGYENVKTEKEIKKRIGCFTHLVEVETERTMAVETLLTSPMFHKNHQENDTWLHKLEILRLKGNFTTLVLQDPNASSVQMYHFSILLVIIKAHIIECLICAEDFSNNCSDLTGFAAPGDNHCY